MAVGATRINRVTNDEIAKRLDDHEMRIKDLEDIADNLERIGDTVEKIFRYLKIAAPSIVSAAIAAGIVNGKVGEFLNALIS